MVETTHQLWLLTLLLPMLAKLDWCMFVIVNFGVESIDLIFYIHIKSIQLT